MLYPNSQPRHQPRVGARDDEDTRGQGHGNTEVLRGRVRRQVGRLTVFHLFCEEVANCDFL